MVEKNASATDGSGANTSILVEFEGPGVNLNRARCLGIFQFLRPVRIEGG